MLIGIASDNKAVSVAAGYGSIPWVSVNATQPYNGFLRYVNGNLEINNNGYWSACTTAYPSININSELEKIMEWASKKMEEDRLAEQYPIVKSAQENLQTCIDLVKDY